MHDSKSSWRCLNVVAIDRGLRLWRLSNAKQVLNLFEKGEDCLTHLKNRTFFEHKHQDHRSPRAERSVNHFYFTVRLREVQVLCLVKCLFCG